MKYNPNGIPPFELKTILVDLNGTLAVFGKVKDSTKDQIKNLLNLGFEIYLLTGDQRGNAQIMADELGIKLVKASTAEEKENFILTLDNNYTVAIGNGRIDIGMFKHAKLSIATLQSEGIHAEILKHVDIIIPSITDAFKLLADENAMNATMRV